MSEQIDNQRYYVQNKSLVSAALATPYKELNSSDKLVLLNLLSYIGKRYYSWPSQATIARSVGLSERQIRYCLVKLISMGFITKMRKGYRFEKYGIRETRSTAYDLSKLVLEKRKLMR